MLENYFEDAKETLSRALAPNSTISVTSFNSELANQLVVTASTVDTWGATDSGRANMNVVLSCTSFNLRAQRIGSRTTQQLHLVVLCSEGDNLWTYNMKNKVWHGYYPSAVAIDKDTLEVYLLFISSWGVELKHFAQLPPDFLEEFEESCNEIKPYHIFIDARALFMVLDGAEGYNHLLRNLYIEFNSTQPYRLPIRGSIAYEEQISAGEIIDDFMDDEFEAEEMEDLVNEENVVDDAPLPEADDAADGLFGADA